MSIKNNKLKVNDFFCGCGGVGLGFIKAGYDVIWACDYDKYAVQTYKQNVGEHVIQADIKLLTYKDIPKADVWAFGFPCQDLSVCGKQKGFRFKCKDCDEQWEYDDAEYKNGLKCPKCGGENFQVATRSGMFFEMMRLLDETLQQIPDNMPKALFIENVKGLKPYITMLESELKKRGYTANVQLYNSKYWGVPQNRERYFIIGLSKGITGFVFPEEQHDNVPKLSTVIDKDVDEKYFIDDKKAQIIIEQVLERLKELGRIHAVLTPDRINKRQNGPRGKTEETEMFTLTTQDIHGVIIDDTFGYDKKVRVYDETSPTLRSGRQGLKVVEPFIIQTPRGNNKGNIHSIAPTLTSNACQENNFICEDVSDVEQEIRDEQGIVISNQGTKFERFSDVAGCLMARDYKGFGNQGMTAIIVPKERVYDIEGISPTLNTCGSGNREVKIFNPKNYRVRKLTPTEYGRLQAFPMENWKQVVSNSQAYKQFGNAVTVNVVAAIAATLKEVLNANNKNTKEMEMTELDTIESNTSGVINDELSKESEI